MELTYLGHAGFLITHEKTSLFIDPWLSSRGAYDSAWLQFPCNHHLGPITLNKAKDFDDIYVYVSHEHKDHFDVEFLSTLLLQFPKTTFIIPKFKAKSFSTMIEKLRPHQIIQLSDEESYLANSLLVTIFIDDGGYNHDSGILVRASGKTFLNFNDCKIFDRCDYIKNKFGPIDIFTAQFSGATRHPICYEMSEQDYKKISKKKKSSKYFAILSALKALNPHRYLPSAGPPALLDPMHYQINFQSDSVFPHQFDVIKFISNFNLTCHLDSVMPGDVYCFEKDQYLTLAQERVTEESYQSVMEHYAQKTQHLFQANEALIPQNLKELFSKYYNHLHAKVQKFFIKDSILHTLYFSINELENYHILVDLNKQICVETNEITSENYYLISYPAWQIQSLLEGRIDDTDLLLTFRSRLTRSPDIYNTWIDCFLNSQLSDISENIKTVEAIKENSERIIVDCNGVQYQIKRYCPHQGADLKYGWHENGHWVCPKHRWQYNLLEGGKCASSDASIDAQEMLTCQPVESE